MFEDAIVNDGDPNGDLVQVVRPMPPDSSSTAIQNPHRGPPAITRDLRVDSIRPLVPPALLLEELPLTEEKAARVSRARADVGRIISGQDDRLLVVVGPCSIHDTTAGLDYACRLKTMTNKLASDLCIVMRAYLEKPRTTIGWKGLINDPGLDDSFAINHGLRIARRFLLDLVDMGMPAGCEFLDPISPQFTSDLVTWGAIGARTAESQVHRELASGLSMPVGFKNGITSDVQGAIDAVRAARHPHRFLGVTETGLAAIVSTCGNPSCHVILRGGRSGPNYDETNVAMTVSALRGAGLPPRLMIDASHGNSDRDYRRQPIVVRDVAGQVARGQAAIVGMMIESFIVDGRQDCHSSAKLIYGQSITDPCISWSTTVPLLQELAESVRARRRWHRDQGIASS